MSSYDENGPIWINVGEPSGDMHAALLARELTARAPEIPLVGMGGPAMAEAGVEVRHSMDLVSVVGLTESLAALPKIIGLLRRVKTDIGRVRPRAIVLTDSPEFNFKVARIGKRLGIPVYYFISPQIWAWRSGRANFLREHVRTVLCILPFEKDFYARYGMEVDYVGNPLMDHLPLAELDAITPDEKRIGLLPGSRQREVRTLLPEFGDAARTLLAKDPELMFTMVRAPGMDRDALLSRWPSDVPVEIVEPENRYRAIRSCRFVLAASGTVTLECALMGTPAIVAYQMSALNFFLINLVVNVKYMSLPNLIMGCEVFPEVRQKDATAGPLADLATRWLDAGGIEQARASLENLRQLVGDPGATGRAAEIILNDLKGLRG